jgi:hypothetical protein
MNEADPLAGLRDIHAPLPPDGLSAWPIVAGAAAAVLLVALAAWLLLRRRQRWAGDLARMLEPLTDLAPDKALTHAALLLSRAAALKLGAAATKLQGREWLGALDGLFQTSFFSSGKGQVFGDALYEKPLLSADAEPVLAELKRVARRRALLPW